MKTIWWVFKSQAEIVVIYRGVRVVSRYLTVMAMAPVQSGPGGLAMLERQRSMNIELG